jgi:hypothetical protein
MESVHALLYGQSVDHHWVRHKQYDKWQDALRASEILGAQR